MTIRSALRREVRYGSLAILVIQSLQNPFDRRPTQYLQLSHLQMFLARARLLLSATWKKPVSEMSSLVILKIT
jgi:hypothetical protein